MKSLKDVNVKNERVVLRAGYDVPVEYGQVTDDTRIRASLDTVRYIIEQRPKLFVIINHMGRPDGKREGGISNQIVAEKLQELLGDSRVEVLDNLKALDAAVKESENDYGKVYMLENIRFWKEEKENDEEFAKRIGQNFDLYVNDAFSVSHREHASFVGIPKYTSDKCMGILFEKEYENLTKIKDDPEHPAVMVIGGAKIETKLPVIENMMKIYDKVLVGGMVANEALDEKLDLGEKVMLPVDFAPEGKEYQRLDIGPKTVELFVKEIEKANTIVWNGPLGKFEDEEAAQGTETVGKAIAANQDALQVIGGGETLEAIKIFGEFSDFDYVSMSGGAMLEYLEGKELPGLKALE